MPLIKDGRFTTDDWTRIDADNPLPQHGKAIILLDQLLQAGESAVSDNMALGVAVPNDTDPAVLAPWLAKLDLIAITFPKFADGRGFSLAWRLRRMGFKGELRASGHVIADQYAFAGACGFDTVEISEAQARRQPEVHWRAADEAISLSYQQGYGGPQNILAARRAALQAAA